MPGETSQANEVDKVVTRLLVILLSCWHETGYGHVEIKSERIKRDRIAVTIMGSTHYRYVISKEDLQHWWREEEESSHGTTEYEVLTQLNNYLSFLKESGIVVMTSQWKDEKNSEIFNP